MTIIANTKTAGNASGALPLATRLRAWWEGVEPAELSSAAPAAKPTAAVRPAAPARAIEPAWSTPRVKMLQLLWGGGFSNAGGPDFALWFAGPCALDAQHVVVELGAGLGGSSRTIERELGCWITGHERNPELAAAGMELSNLAGVGKKVPIERYDAEDFDLKPGACDAILSREAVFSLKNRKGFFDEIARALKTGGHLAYVDILQIPREGDPTAAFRTWVKGEAGQCAPWTLIEHRQAMAERSLDLRVADDITAVVRGQVMQAMADLMLRPEAIRAMEPAGKAALDSEIGRWTRRIAAIDAGDIGYCRFHAIKVSTRTMSNW